MRELWWRQSAEAFSCPYKSQPCSRKKLAAGLSWKERRRNETCAVYLPVPVNGTNSASSFAIRFSFASRLPVALGVKVTLMVQELPGANEAGQKLWNVKSPG